MAKIKILNPFSALAELAGPQYAADYDANIFYKRALDYSCGLLSQAFPENGYFFGLLSRITILTHPYFHTEGWVWYRG